MRISEYNRNCLGYEFYYTALAFLANDQLCKVLYVIGNVKRCRPISWVLACTALHLDFLQLFARFWDYHSRCLQVVATIVVRSRIFK